MKLAFIVCLLCLFMKVINLVIFTQDQKGDALNVLCSIWFVFILAVPHWFVFTLAASYWFVFIFICIFLLYHLKHIVKCTLFLSDVVHSSTESGGNEDHVHTNTNIHSFLLQVMIKELRRGQGFQQRPRGRACFLNKSCIKSLMTALFLKCVN